MATPTIIIGIGTSGLAALENAQRYYHEATKTKLPEHIAMIFLETNENNNVGLTYYDNAISRVFLSLYQMDRMVTRLRETKNSAKNWLPPSAQVVSAGMGAGGIRPCGRLSLWGTNDNKDNFTDVINSIKNAFNKITSIGNAGPISNKRPVVIITGSTTGGTGSGCFIDLAYLVRDILPNVERVFGLLLLPNTPSNITGNEVKYANTFGALQDLDYFNQVGQTYLENWPNGKDVDIDAPPFDLTHFISGDHKDGSIAVTSLSGLYKLAGMYLFLNIMGGALGNEYRCLYEKRMERLVDASGNFLIGKYGSFGLSAIQFPKEQIEEFIACNLGNTLIKRWLDDKNYVHNNNLTNILKNDIKQQVFKKFDQIISEAFKTLYNYGSESLEQSIEADAMKIANKQINDDEIQFISRLFSSTSKTGYYGKVSNNLVAATNYIVEEIEPYISGQLNETENIEIARLSLQYFGEAILSCQQLWNSYGVRSETNLWENFLSTEAAKASKNKYGIILEKSNVLKDRLLTLFDMMIMHLITKELTKVRKSMENDSAPLLSSIKRVELPNVTFFDKIKTKLLELVKSGQQTQADYNFDKRKNYIADDVNDDGSMIKRVYPSNFEEEVERAEKVYYQKSGRVLPSKADLQDYKSEQEINDLFQYFKNTDINNFDKKVYSDVIHSYKATVSRLECVKDYNVLEYVRTNPGDTKSMAEKALKLLLASNDGTPPNSYLPKLIISNDDAQIGEVISIFRNQLNYNEFENKPDNKLAIPTLRNMIVFYFEKGGFNPLYDLPYAAQMQNCYAKKPLTITEKVSDEVWTSYRKAYNIPNQ
jgi:Tubulin like